MATHTTPRPPTRRTAVARERRQQRIAVAYRLDDEHRRKLRLRAQRMAMAGNLKAFGVLSIVLFVLFLLIWLAYPVQWPMLEDFLRFVARRIGR